MVVTTRGSVAKVATMDKAGLGTETRPDVGDRMINVNTHVSLRATPLKFEAGTVVVGDDDQARTGVKQGAPDNARTQYQEYCNAEPGGTSGSKDKLPSRTMGGAPGP